jgi:hypothetical protein
MDHPAGVSLSCDGNFYIANRKDRSIIRSKAPSRDQLFSSDPSKYVTPFPLCVIVTL